MHAQVPNSHFAYLVDADFMLPPDFSTKLTTGRSGALLLELRRAWRERRERRAVVVPAFGRSTEELPEARRGACAPSFAERAAWSQCWIYDDRYDVPLTKTRLKAMVNVQHTVEPFYESRVRSNTPICGVTRQR